MWCWGLTQARQELFHWVVSHPTSLIVCKWVNRSVQVLFSLFIVSCIFLSYFVFSKISNSHNIYTIVVSFLLYFHENELPFSYVSAFTPCFYRHIWKTVFFCLELFKFSFHFREVVKLGIETGRPVVRFSHPVMRWLIVFLRRESLYKTQASIYVAWDGKLQTLLLPES